MVVQKKMRMILLISKVEYWEILQGKTGCIIIFECSVAPNEDGLRRKTPYWHVPWRRSLKRSGWMLHASLRKGRVESEPASSAERGGNTSLIQPLPGANGPKKRQPNCLGCKCGLAINGRTSLRKCPEGQTML